MSFVRRMTPTLAVLSRPSHLSMSPTDRVLYLCKDDIPRYQTKSYTCVNRLQCYQPILAVLLLDCPPASKVRNGRNIWSQRCRYFRRHRRDTSIITSDNTQEVQTTQSDISDFGRHPSMLCHWNTDVSDLASHRHS